MGLSPGDLEDTPAGLQLVLVSGGAGGINEAAGKCALAVRESEGHSAGEELSPGWGLIHGR